MTQQNRNKTDQNITNYIILFPSQENKNQSLKRADPSNPKGILDYSFIKLNLILIIPLCKYLIGFEHIKGKEGNRLQCQILLGYLVLFKSTMRDQAFEDKLLIKQNLEMSAKLQAYRRDNQELTRKNQELNVWVLNLAQVVAAISSAWKTITDGQEALYALMRKKTDANSKTVIAKYVSHFRAFEEIVNNLGEKITNAGHSEAATMEAKTRINAFVSNYQLFFNEFIESYFKFNEDYGNWLGELGKQPDMAQHARIITQKEIQNRQKIKEFEIFFQKHKDTAKAYEFYTQNQLLTKLITSRNQEVALLKEFSQKQARRITLITDYETANIAQIMDDESLLDCNCGAGQLKYFKAKFEDRIRNIGSETKQNGDTHEPVLPKYQRQEFDLLEAQKKELIERNSSLQLRIEKIRQQNKFTEETVLSSQVYSILKGQCKDLIDYTSGLLKRLSKSYEYLNDIEKCRADEIEEMRRKCQKQHGGQSASKSSHFQNNGHSAVLFRQDLTQSVKDLKKEFSLLNEKSQGRQEILTNSKRLFREVKKQNEDMSATLAELQEEIAKRHIPLEFRHEKFTELQVSITEILKNSKDQHIQKTKRGWEMFVEYVKTRDKKIKDLENQIKKRDKDIAQKDRLEQILKETLLETENIYTSHKEKLNKFEAFVSKTEKELSELAEENYKLRIEHEQEKSILAMRLKAETEIRNKYQEKVRCVDKIEEQVQIIRRSQQTTQLKFNAFVGKEKEKCEKLVLLVKEKELLLEQLNTQLEEKNKIIERCIEEKEKLKAEINALFLRLRNIEEKSQFQALKCELEEYKRKIMCVCGGDREREVVLKTCPHFFCRKCIEDTTANRNRRCPICAIKFTKTDVHEIVWN